MMNLADVLLRNAFLFEDCSIEYLTTEIREASVVTTR
jgi:hypothetical protein